MRLRFFVVLLITLVLIPSVSKAQTSDQTKPAAPPKEAIEPIKDKNAKATRMNGLIEKANQAMQTRDWRQLEELTQKLIAEDPARWQFYQGLGNAQLNLGRYDEAIKTYDKALELVSKETDSPAHPGGAQARTAAVGRMLTNQGNAYLKLKKNDEAVRAYTKAAAVDPNPATAYFNVCATQYNLGNMEGAVASCRKAVEFDPKKADACFILGSALFGNGKMDSNNRYVLPPGTVEALRKYLELAPDGGHAGDVKAMLESIGEKVPAAGKPK